VSKELVSVKPASIPVPFLVRRSYNGHMALVDVADLLEDRRCLGCARYVSPDRRCDESSGSPRRI